MKITLVEAMGHILPMFSSSLIDYAEKHFRETDIELLQNTRVLKVEANHIIVKDGSGEEKKIHYGILFI